MKISAFHKKRGNFVILKTDYENLEPFDKVYVSKVFTDTDVPQRVLQMPNVEIGGTGFYFDKANPLPYEIEHSMPDYHLYDGWVEWYKGKGISGISSKHFRNYTDYSIGFTTRGCFRQCGFCVNQQYKQVKFHARPSEFVDVNRKKICLLDDNFFGYPGWEEILMELKAYNKPIVFKQVLDVRLLTERKCELLFSLKYDGEYIFAFDDIADYSVIERKIKMIREFTNKSNIKFYILVGFKNTGIDDIQDMFKRIQLLFRYRCLPYIMRYQSQTEAPWRNSEYAGIYTAAARWCNQPGFCKTLSFREFAIKDNARTKTKMCASLRALHDFEKTHKDIADQFFDMKWGV